MVFQTASRLLNSPYVGDMTASNYSKSVGNSQRRRIQSPAPTLTTRLSGKNRSESLQRLALPQNHSGYEPKIAEDFVQELLNVKKLAQTLTADNQALKTRVKRLQDENLRRSRELEQVIERAPDAEFAVPPGSSGAVIKRLKTRLVRMEIMLKEKDQHHLRQNSSGVDGLPSATADGNEQKRRTRISSIDAQLHDKIDAVRNELETAVLENKQLKQKCSMLDSWLNEKK